MNPIPVERPPEGKSPGVVLLIDGYRKFLNPLQATLLAGEIAELVKEQVE